MDASLLAPPVELGNPRPSGLVSLAPSAALSFFLSSRDLLLPNPNEENCQPLVVGKDYCDLGLPTTREACVLSEL